MKFVKLILALLLCSTQARAVTEVCVEVEMKSWEKRSSDDSGKPSKDKTPAESSPPKKGASLGNFFGQTVDPPMDATATGDAESPNSAGTNQTTQEEDERQSGLPAIPFAQKGTAPASDPAADGAASEVDLNPRLLPVTDPHGIDPARYLKRMLEYEITHERGFLSVEEGCSERVTVELYALDEGWTVFARYSGHAREEKVDRVDLDEFVELAQRMIRALLRDKSISETVTRENVLKADSEIEFRTIRGTSHLLFGMGTAVRVGVLPTATAVNEPANNRLRLLTPLSIHLGYRGKLKAWGLDAFVRMHLGTASKGIRSNPLGGHVDYTGSGLAGLHFLRYSDAAGIGSLYLGGGASFELSYFEAISPPNEFGEQERRTLLGGGLDLDALVGYEFMRTSSVHFFTQLEVHAPTYLIDTERGTTKLRAYLPGGLAQIGVVF